MRLNTSGYLGAQCIFMYPKRRSPSQTPQGERIHLWDNIESPKTFQIYIPGQRQIETSRDVVIEEEIAFQRSRESQMEIDREIIPPPPSTVQREKDIIPVDLVAPVDMLNDIAARHKMPTQTHYARGIKAYKLLKEPFEKVKQFFKAILQS